MKFYICLGSILLFVMGCGSDVVVQTPVSNQKTIDKVKEIRKEHSRSFVEYENKAIDTLVQIKNWNMIKTKSGLRHSPLSNCEGKYPKRGDLLEIEVEIQDIHENVIFPPQPQTVHFRKDYTVNGLVEALSKMCVGTKAKLILPSHLAYGFRGYEKEIGSNQVLIYNVELINKKLTK